MAFLSMVTTWFKQKERENYIQKEIKYQSGVHDTEKMIINKKLKTTQNQTSNLS